MDPLSRLGEALWGYARAYKASTTHLITGVLAAIIVVFIFIVLSKAAIGDIVGAIADVIRSPVMLVALLTIVAVVTFVVAGRNAQKHAEKEAARATAEAQRVAETTKEAVAQYASAQAQAFKAAEKKLTLTNEGLRIIGRKSEVFSHYRHLESFEPQLRHEYDGCIKIAEGVIERQEAAGGSIEDQRDESQRHALHERKNRLAKLIMQVNADIARVEKRSPPREPNREELEEKTQPGDKAFPAGPPRASWRKVSIQYHQLKHRLPEVLRNLDQEDRLLGEKLGEFLNRSDWS